MSTELGRVRSINALLTGLEDKKEKVIYSENGNRAIDGEVFLEKIEKLYPLLGIERVADISYLAFNNYSVFQTVRPNIFGNYRCGQNSGSQGKGPSPTQAKISAIMEGIESACAEPKNEFLIRASYDEIKNQHFVLPLSKFVGVKYRSEHAKESKLKEELSVKEKLVWTKALHVGTGQEILVPAETVFFPFFPSSFDTLPRFPNTSNGLASGGSYLDAVIHGIYEVIERHYIHLLEAKDSGLVVEALYEEEFPGLENITNDLDERFELQLMVLKSPKYENCPMIRCLILDDEGNAYDGWGCCFDVDMAIDRAVSEALQSLATCHSGSREDVDEDEEFGEGFIDKLPEYRSLRICEYKEQVIDKEFETLQEEFDAQIEWLNSHSFSDVCIANLTRVGIDVPVVKVIIPNMIPEEGLICSYNLSTENDMRVYSYSI